MDLKTIGLDNNYSVDTEIYDLFGNEPTDIDGKKLIESVEVVDKTTEGFKISFLLNSNSAGAQSLIAEQFQETGVDFTATPGSYLDRDVLVRVKVNSEYAVPILTANYSYDADIQESLTKSQRKTFVGTEFDYDLKGESLLAQGNTVQALGVSDVAQDGIFGNNTTGIINGGVVGWDLPLWVKRDVGKLVFSFTGELRPSSSHYDIITFVNVPEGVLLELPKGSSPHPEGFDLDAGFFTVENKTSNGFVLRSAVIPEPAFTNNTVTNQNGKVKVNVKIKERSVLIRHDLQTIGEQTVLKLAHSGTIQFGGDLSWKRHGPNAIRVISEEGHIEPFSIDATINTQTFFGDEYRIGAQDGTRGGMRRQGSGILPQLSAMRTQISAMKRAELKDGGSFSEPQQIDTPESLLPEMLSLRALTQRLQNIKTILYKNGLIALEGTAQTGDSTEILSSIIPGHFKGLPGSAPKADPAAKPGIPGETVFSAVVKYEKGISATQVVFPEHILKRIARNELKLKEDEYVVILDIFGSVGENLTFDSETNPFFIENKTLTGFVLSCTDTFDTDVDVRYYVCLRQKQDDIIQRVKSRPIVSPSEFTNPTTTTETPDGTPLPAFRFNLNNARSLALNAIDLKERFDSVRNILRNGQNIPFMWCRVGWKYDEEEDYFNPETGEIASKTLKIRGWGTDTKGFSMPPKLMFQTGVIYTKSGAALGSPIHDSDKGGDNNPADFHRSYTARIRFYYGVNSGNSADYGPAVNYQNFDPGLGRLSPLSNRTDSSPVGNQGNKMLRPEGFPRGAFVTERGHILEELIGAAPGAAFSEVDDSWESKKGYPTKAQRNVLPPYTVQLNSGIEANVGGTGHDMFFVDYGVWLLRGFDYATDSFFAGDAAVGVGQNPGYAVWTTKAPFDLVLVGRPNGVGFDEENSTFIPKGGNALYDDNGILE